MKPFPSVAESIVAKPRRPLRCLLGYHSWVKYYYYRYDTQTQRIVTSELVALCVLCEKRVSEPVG